jgi:hypothetical protein
VIARKEITAPDTPVRVQQLVALLNQSLPNVPRGGLDSRTSTLPALLAYYATLPAGYPWHKPVLMCLYRFEHASSSMASTKEAPYRPGRWQRGFFGDRFWGRCIYQPTFFAIFTKFADKVDALDCNLKREPPSATTAGKGASRMKDMLQSQARTSPLCDSVCLAALPRRPRWMLCEAEALLTSFRSLFLIIPSLLLFSKGSSQPLPGRSSDSPEVARQRAWHFHHCVPRNRRCLTTSTITAKGLSADNVTEKDKEALLMAWRRSHANKHITRC